MFRNVTQVVAPVADANNYLLPLWMIGFGVALLRYGRPRDPRHLRLEPPADDDP
jgi:hypothetical protein